MTFYKLLQILFTVVFKIIYKIEIIGIENIPIKGRAIICSNHISNIDPIILSVVSNRPISYMAKKELFNNKLFGTILSKLYVIPVDRGNTDLAAIRKSLNVLKNEQVLGIFPEGTRVKKMDLNSAKPGISLIAIKAKSPVIPIFIEANYKLFSHIRVNIGKPICLDDYYDKKLNTNNHKDISKNILKSIYDLKNNRGENGENLYS